MPVVNVHERKLKLSATEAGGLIDGLASQEDRLWPHDRWPAMRLDCPLELGAAGGHGPIRYRVDEYDPGRRVLFEFTGPPGFHGHHRFELEEAGEGVVRLRNVLEMNTRGRARLAWPLVFCPLHDALMEDALDRAETLATGKTIERDWPTRVRFLRRLLRRLA